MNNYCRNCGNKMSENGNYCTECGIKVINKRINTDNKWIIYLILIIVLPFFTMIPFASLISLILIMICKEKYKGHSIFKILFWISMISFLISAIFLMRLITSCL